MPEQVSFQEDHRTTACAGAAANAVTKPAEAMAADARVMEILLMPKQTSSDLGGPLHP